MYNIITRRAALNIAQQKRDNFNPAWSRDLIVVITLPFHEKFVKTTDYNHFGAHFDLLHKTKEKFRQNSALHFCQRNNHRKTSKKVSLN